MPTYSSINQTSTFYCSQNSAALGELLSGTATQASAWLMIEYPGIWNAKAFNDSSIPSQVKEYLSIWTGSNPHARIQLIRNAKSASSSKISVYLALPNRDHPLIYRWLVDHFKELLDIDFDHFSDSEVDEDFIHSKPLFLVCTNGRRDPCCSKFGLAVFAGLSARYPDDAWETTHLGGHRFAANLLCFPHGVLYGRVTPTSVSEIALMYQSGLLMLEKLRGRVCFPEPAQAAEFYLRDQLQNRRIETLSLLQLDQPIDQEWQAVFLNNETGKIYLVILHQEPFGLETMMNCSDEIGQRVSQYHLEGIEELP